MIGLKKLTNTMVVISVLLLIYYVYIHVNPLDTFKIFLGVMGLVLIIIPIIYEKYNKKKIEEYIKLIYYFFLLVAFILGGLFQLYYSTTYFDLFVHGIFGLLLSIILGTKIKINSLRNFVFLMSLVLLVGFIWEMLEFGSDIVFGTDHQEKIGGAYDTMTDLLISLFGVLFYSSYILIMNKIKR